MRYYGKALRYLKPLREKQLGELTARWQGESRVPQMFTRYLWPALSAPLYPAPVLSHSEDMSKECLASPISAVYWQCVAAFWQNSETEAATAPPAVVAAATKPSSIARRGLLRDSAASRALLHRKEVLRVLLESTAPRLA